MTNAENDIQIGIVGAGLIGLSWAGLFSAFGYQIIVYDPFLKQKDLANKTIEDIWASLESLFEDLKNKKEVKFSVDLFDLAGTSFIQENLPEDLNLKREIISKLEKTVSVETIIASSTSSFLPSELQEHSANPDRIMVGHPMNPPHLIPAVEIVLGKMYSLKKAERAKSIYRSVHRVPIQIKKENQMLYLSSPT